MPGRRTMLLAAAAGLPSTARAADVSRLGVYKGAGCDGLAEWPAFTAWLGHSPGWIVDFLAMESWAEIRATADWVPGCWRGAPQRLSIGVPLLPKEERSSLAAGAGGAYDEQFRYIARALVAQGRADAVLRLGWEFNGDWYPWAAHRDPNAFVACWQRVVRLMRGVPGAAFRFEWTSALGAAALDPERAWPGRDVVDVIGLNVYNESWRVPVADQEGRWREIRDAPRGLEWHRRFAAAQGRPRAFAEWGTGQRTGGRGGGDDPFFVTRMAEWVTAPDILYHGYWDYPAPDYDGLLSTGQRPRAARAFIEAFGAAGRVPR